MREMCQTFGITALGETVESWTLENEFLTAEVLTYGATLRRLVFGGVDVVLGYDTLSEYERNVLRTERQDVPTGEKRRREPSPRRRAGI